MVPRKSSPGKIFLMLVAAALIAIGLYYVGVNYEIQAREEKCLASLRRQLEQGLSPDSIYTREYEELPSMPFYHDGKLVPREDHVALMRQLTKH